MAETPDSPIVDELRRKRDEMTSLLASQETRLRRAQAAVDETRRRCEAIEMTMREFTGKQPVIAACAEDGKGIDGVEALNSGESAFADIVRGIVTGIAGEFNAPEVAKMISTTYPSLDGDELMVRVSKVLARLGREQKISIVTPGVSRRPATYRNGPSSGGSAM